MSEPYSDALQWIDLSHATLSQVRASVAAVADAIPAGHPLPTIMETRWRGTQTGDFPAAALSLLRDENGWAGWSGWCPYAETPHTWQSTTYFADRLRGSGLLTEARCRQQHARPIVTEWNIQRGAPHTTFVSSIREDNSRSIAASRRYAQQHGWHDTGHIVYEEEANRFAWLLTWPDSDAHTCRRQPVA